MENNRSGGETSSMGYMKETIEMRLLRIIGSSLRSDDRRALGFKVSSAINSGLIVHLPFLRDGFLNLNLLP